MPQMWPYKDKKKKKKKKKLQVRCFKYCWPGYYRTESRSECAQLCLLLNGQQLRPLCLLMHSDRESYKEGGLFPFFGLCRAASAAHGGSQAGGPIGAVATGLRQSTAMRDPSCVCNLHHNSQQHWIPNPLSKARD